MSPTRAWSAVLVAALLPLAGCLEGESRNQEPSQDPPDPELLPDACPYRDCSWEWWNATFSGNGTFRVAVPLRVSDPGTTFEEWWTNVTVEGEATVTQANTSKGRALVVEGTPPVTVRSHAFHGNQPIGNGLYAEAYLDAQWTTRDNDTDYQTLPVQAEAGTVHVTLRYDVHSNWCGGAEVYEGDVTAQGWRNLTRTEGTMACE